DKAGWREAAAPVRLASLMRRQQTDLLHAFLFPANWRAVVSARLAGVRRVICSVRSTGVWMNGRHRVMERLTLPRASAIVANAPAVREDLIQRLGLRPERVQVIMNGVDTDQFHPGDGMLRRQWGADNGSDPVIGFVGSLRDAKDPALFLAMARKVAGRVPRARFVLVGDGPLREELVGMARATQLDGRVVFAGERSDIPDVMRSIDLLAVTSVREGCCNAILEAMASGVPVVATAVGGNPDLITQGLDGLLFPHGDAGAGAEAVESLLGRHDLARDIAAAGLQRARTEFSVEAMVRATSALYEVTT
ncbi:MAG TPA: glycosyltransferase, partial [Patescibacteria group bacterium]|nr:glycosyltransferase [Patescibacteria group bacterium]